MINIENNPLISEYNTVHCSIPFEQIKIEHFLPAFEYAISQHEKEIDAIVKNSEIPNFQNVIEALDCSGALLNRVSDVFFNLLSAETNDQLQELSLKISPLLSEHSMFVILNEKLFEKVKLVYENIDNEQFSTEERMLLKDSYDSFADNGIALEKEDRESLKELSKELSTIKLQYSQNILKETNSYSLHIDDIERLNGLPDDLINILSDNAKKQNKSGWIIDLKPTCYIPLLKYAADRELRREIYMAYSSRCMKGGEFDNLENVKKIVNLRLKKAQLLGHKCYADYVLKDRMAENVENVYKLLDELFDSHRPIAEREYAEIQQFAKDNGDDLTIEPWDWSYYSEKLRKQKFNLDDELLRPYFELEKVQKGVFWLANKLYGLNFIPNMDVELYHSDVKAYDVTDENGNFVALFYADYHPREGKRAGAWMNTLKLQWFEDRTDSRPHIINVMNFTTPATNKPSLLRFDEVTTLLHEFGHGLHGMLSKVKYRSHSCTNVYWDFVELPSQIMENWALEKEFLDKFAVHYITGENIPKELVEKVKIADSFNVGYACLRQLSFGYLDMKWHTLTEPFCGDVEQFDYSAMAEITVLPIVKGTAMSPAFSHIFAGGYAAGYYSYKWSEVLDADAFSQFLKNGIFDKKTATSFKENILEKGGSEHPMTLYKNFKGSEPTIEALLKRNGLKQ